MATIAETAATAADTMKERLGPALDTLEENVRHARRTIVQGRHAAEDFVTGTTLEVRRRPLAAVALAVGAGAVVGCLIGFALGWRTHDRTRA